MTEDLLGPLRDAPAESALILDVDGTLAPIVARPELAAVPQSTRDELQRLVGRYLLVACVSGRTGDEAHRLVGVEGVRYVGNHGLELAPEAEEFASRIAAFRDAVGLEVEDKRLTLSYHFREATDEAATHVELERVAERAREDGLVPRWGRKVLEIRPPVAASKGTAVRALIAESGARQALYAGDDATDLDGFEGLANAGLEHFVRVAVVSSEGPPDLAKTADLLVESPEELAGLLGSL